jgi:AcrR family transcriptional regulator
MLMPRILSEDDVSDFRARLCEAALRRFGKEGEAGISFRKLAQDLGVSATTPYRYFKDKDAIMAALRADAFDRFALALERAYDRSEGHALVRARIVMQAYIDFVRADPKAYRLMFDGSSREMTGHPDLQRASTRAKATMSRHIVGLVEAGLLPAETDAPMLGFVLWSQLHGSVMLHLAGKLNAATMFKIVEEATRLVLRGAGLKIKVKAEAA